MAHTADSLTRFRCLLRLLLRQSLGRIGLELRRVRPVPVGADLHLDLRRRLTGVPRPVIFDIGANVGDFLMSVRNDFPQAEIHAFEPSPEVYQTLQRTTERRSNVILNNIAMGSRRGERVLQEHSRSVMSSFLSPGPAMRTGPAYWDRGVERETPVPVETVDAYCADRGVSSIDLLKIDTEGYDLEVLRGAERMLSDGRVGLVLVEIIFRPYYIDMAEPEALYRRLRDHGFCLVSIYEWLYSDDGFANAADALFQRAPDENSCPQSAEHG